MNNKELNIVNVRQRVGWVYSDMKWLTEKEAELANKKRDRLLKYLSDKVNYSFMQGKVQTGELSPGCLICKKGYWSCIFINGLCTGHCFYCPQDRKIKQERFPMEEIPFDDPKNYVAYLEKFNFKGVGFSGGETLLVFDKLLMYIEKIRERFGKSMYLWMYTNGDLVTKDKLRSLNQSGLDEIRFNISANNYDLRPAELAVNIMKTVTVEIPSIPEDYEIVKRRLTKMQKMGIKYLNIHQLHTTQYNYRNFIDRDYTFLHQPGVPIFESEMSALKLVKYALDNKIYLPINYCSATYKNRFQGMGERARKADLIKKSFEELTDYKYIRSLSVQDSFTSMEKIIKILLRSKCRLDLWSLNDTKTEIFIHSSLLKYIDFNKHSLIISYFMPFLATNAVVGEVNDGTTLSFKEKIFIKKELVFQQKLSSKVTIEVFQKIFIENLDWIKALKYFYKNYKLKNNESLIKLKNETELLSVIKIYENLDGGLAEIY
jgi:pyruvate formate-lyase activating enzyme-like uncharacterized protein